MKKTLFVLTVLISTLSSFSQDTNDKVVLQAMRSISSEELMDNVKKMCDEKYAGRLTGTKEYQECAEWLAGEFSKWGLSPPVTTGAGFNGLVYRIHLFFPIAGFP